MCKNMLHKILIFFRSLVKYISYLHNHKSNSPRKTYKYKKFRGLLVKYAKYVTRT